MQSHSPCGECGLKYTIPELMDKLQLSLPMRGVWIEIIVCKPSRQRFLSLPMRGVWIEILKCMA